jgi:N-acetylmuramoyl-L-alanine amidase
MREQELDMASAMEVQPMFLDYYQLREQPFGAVSDPAYLYASHTHCEALESFADALLSDRGNLVLIAESGMGKTTLLRQLLEGLHGTGRGACIFTKQCDVRDVLQFLLTELGIDSTGMEPAAMHGKLNEIWFAEMLAGKRFVLIFDDAEELSDSVLHVLRQFSRYETSNSKLLQAVLCGQPQLLQTLERDELEPVRKRIAEFKRLEPLSPMETAGYVRQRIYAAGRLGESLFEPEALALVAELSEGVPGNINKICSRALLEAYARGLRSVSPDIIEKASRNLSVAAVGGSIAASPGPSDSIIEEAVGARTNSILTFRMPMLYGLPSSGLWAGAVIGVLLSAGLALPHAMLKGVTQMMRGQQTEISSLTPRAETLQPSSNGALPPVTPHVVTATSPKPSATTDSAVHEAAVSVLEPSGNQSRQFSLTRELGLKINRIVIDPGHGGFDTGAKGPHGLMEKDICLDVALRLGQMIQQNIPGAEVVYTRKDDSYVPLEERTAIANSAGADLFISIHANSSDAREVRGVETYYLSLATSKEAKELAIRENTFTQSSMHDLPDLVQKITRNEKIEESKLLAAEIQDTLSQRLQLVSRREKNRGVKQAPFIVLTGANMPAVLSEISFVSNANDESLLLESGQRQRIAEGLYHGITTYLDGLHSLPENKQKLVTENRTNTFSSLEQSATTAGHNPL